MNVLNNNQKIKNFAIEQVGDISLAKIECAIFDHKLINIKTINNDLLFHCVKRRLYHT